VSETDGYFQAQHDDDIGDEVRRDNQGRPLIMQPDGTRLAYTRASSLGDYVAATEFLRRWEKRYLARQLGRNEDLAALAGLETYSTGFDEDSVTKSASGKRLDSIIDRALERGRIHERADYGTVIHALTEPGNEGYVPVRATIDVHAFWELLEINDVEVLGTELFIVNDKLRTAGTFDHLLRTKQHGVCIGDKKNGRNINGLGFAVQFVTYADGVLYNARTEERIGDLTTLTGGEPVNRKVALLAEVHDGLARFRDVDIERGRIAAELAAGVRDAQGWNAMANLSKGFKAVKASDPAFRERAIVRRIGLARNREELHLIWASYKSEWNDTLTEAGKAKMEAEGWK
jgi:uncharacterized protein (DUF736 family)